MEHRLAERRRLSRMVDVGLCEAQSSAIWPTVTTKGFQRCPLLAKASDDVAADRHRGKESHDIHRDDARPCIQRAARWTNARMTAPAAATASASASAPSPRISSETSGCRCVSSLPVIPVNEDSAPVDLLAVCNAATSDCFRKRCHSRNMASPERVPSFKMEEPFDAVCHSARSCHHALSSATLSLSAQAQASASRIGEQPETASATERELAPNPQLIMAKQSWKEANTKAASSLQ